ncbi:MAG: low molecular weight protein-tyrosine-phosphatase [Pseudohongiellaceae bacterium]
MIWSRPEVRVLFVCTANICRSPLAEGLLRHRLRSTELAGRVQVRSAGTCVGQRGCRPDPRVEQLAAEAGVSLRRIRSRMLTLKMIRSNDYVLVMESRHLEDVGRLCIGHPTGDHACPDNVQLLGRFIPFREAGMMDIPDPYFGDSQGFDHVYEMIDAALTGFLVHLGSHFDNSRNL